MKSIKIGKTLIALDHIIAIRYEDGHLFISIVGMSLQKIKGSAEDLDALYKHLAGIMITDTKEVFDALEISRA